MLDDLTGDDSANWVDFKRTVLAFSALAGALGIGGIFVSQLPEHPVPVPAKIVQNDIPKVPPLFPQAPRFEEGLQDLWTPPEELNGLPAPDFNTDELVGEVFIFPEAATKEQLSFFRGLVKTLASTPTGARILKDLKGKKQSILEFSDKGEWIRFGMAFGSPSFITVNAKLPQQLQGADEAKKADIKNVSVLHLGVALAYKKLDLEGRTSYHFINPLDRAEMAYYEAAFGQLLQQKIAEELTGVKGDPKILWPVLEQFADASVSYEMVLGGKNFSDALTYYRAVLNIAPEDQQKIFEAAKNKVQNWTQEDLKERGMIYRAFDKDKQVTTRVDIIPFVDGGKLVGVQFLGPQKPLKNVKENLYWLDKNGKVRKTKALYEDGTWVEREPGKPLMQGRVEFISSENTPQRNTEVDFVNPVARRTSPAPQQPTSVADQKVPQAPQALQQDLKGI